MARDKKNTDDWLEPLEVQRDAMPAALKAARRQRRFRIAIFVLVALGLLGLASSLLSSSQLSQVRELQQELSSQGNLDAPGRAEATHAVTLWLPETLPGGHVVMWLSAERIDWVAGDGATGLGQDKQATPDYTVWVHTIQVVDSLGQPYLASVKVAWSQDGGAVIERQPYLAPIPVAGLPGNPGPNWPGLTAAQASQSVAASVQTWTQALFSGDATTLLQATGDPDPTHGYVPMPPAWDAVSTITAAAWHPSAGDALPTEMVVETQLSVLWAQSSPDGNAPLPAPADLDKTKATERATIVVDLLITGADTASPRVVAWGPAGTGAELEPYQNAVAVARAVAPKPPVIATPADQLTTIAPANDTPDSQTGPDINTTEPPTVPDVFSTPPATDTQPNGGDDA